MARPARPTHTILVVDDEEPNRLLLDALLRPEAFAVIQAVDGHEAVEAVRRGGVDLVLLDVLMPRMDGFEACRRIRELAGPELPIVFVTAMIDREARVRGKQLGADDFLTKPVDDVELLARVENLIRLRQLARVRAMLQGAREANLRERIPTPADPRLPPQRAPSAARSLLDANRSLHAHVDQLRARGLGDDRLAQLAASAHELAIELSRLVESES